ncbi:MAG: DMT family transporter [Desulfobacterales bacterium]|nr:DMT family transporter [Desulfobacterales bacterium]
MEAILYSLFACCAWGGSDFLGGMKSRKMPVLLLIFTVKIIGLTLLVGILFLYGGAFPDGRHILYACTAGFFGIIGMACIFRGMAIGSIGVISLIGSTSATIPVFFDLLAGNRLSFLQLSGIVLAMTGIIFLSLEKFSLNTKKRLSAGVGLAIIGAVLTGFFFVFIDLASNQDPFWASLFSRLSAFTVIGLALAIQRPGYQFKKADIPVLLGLALLDTTGFIAICVATTTGLVGIVSVLTSLYPVVAIFLAFVFLHEKMKKNQIIGAIVALSGVLLISGG